MDGLPRALDSIKRLWGSLNGPQKLTLAVAAALMVSLLLWGSASAGSDPWQRVIGHEVDAAVRADVLKSLAQKNVAHEVRGSEIHVRKADADRVLMELAGEGLMSDRAIFAWLDSSDPFSTPTTNNRRFQVSLQRKLEFMVRKLDVVRNASVQITQASEAQQIGFKGPGASASVQVELKAGQTLTRVNVIGIAGLVAGAVSGLERDRVHISDTQGNAYSIPRAGSASFGALDLRDVEARLEEDLRKKVLEIFPMTRTVVRVFAKAREERMKEETHPKASVLREKENKTVEETGAETSAASIKGGGEPGAAPAPRTRKTTTESEVENKLDHRLREVYDPAGQIERVSVSVLYPVMKDVEAAPKMEDVRSAVMNATGAAQDSVSVLFVPTRAPEAIAATPPSEQAMEWLLGNWSKIALAVLGLFALAIAAWAIRGAMPRGDVEEIRAITSRLGAPLEDGPLQAGPDGEIGAVRRGIQEGVERAPGEAAAALKSWVGGR